MKGRRLSLTAWAILPGLFWMLSVEAEQPAPLDVEILVPSMLVKITRLTGVGPDDKRLELMSVPEGVAVPIGDFSTLTPSLIALPHRSPVAYHTLQAEMAPGLFAVDHSGKQVQLARPDGFPRVIPLIGAVLKLDKGIRMLEVRPQTPTPEDPRYLPRHRVDDN